jgi:plastocyanin
MHKRLSRYGAFAIVAGALCLPGAAQAATKDMFAGTPPKGLLKGVPGFAIDNAFYPKRIEVRAGDKVSFKIVGFHNVLFAPKGTTPPALFVANPAAPVSGAKDAAGADFWFNGQPSVGPNPLALAPQGGKVIDGTELVGSGLPQGPPKPYVVKFPKKGSYTILCSVHPGMKAKVVVKGKKAQIKTARQDAKRISKQKQAATRLAKKLVAGQGVPKGNTVLAGNDRKGVATLAFFPGTKTVKVGETVDFKLSKGTTEIHNVAFAPEDYAKALAQSFLGPTGIDPITLYPSQPPGTPLAVDGVAHGNGYVNTGILDVEAGTPNPSSAKVTFTKAGTFDYYCIVHGAEMKGQIKVTN